MREVITQFCIDLGVDPLLVQGAGGNISWKEDDTLTVKASGMWMARAGEEDIFVSTGLFPLRRAMAQGEFSLPPLELSSPGKRPSMETLLHALLPQKIVVHLHMLPPLAWLVRKDCEREMLGMLEESAKTIFLNYHTPGEKLAEALSVRLQDTPRPGIVLLKGHGVIIGGENLNEVKEYMALLKEIFHIPSVRPVSIPSLFAPEGYRPIPSNKVQQLVFNPEIFEKIPSNWAIYPDHLVFLGVRPYLYRDMGQWQRENHRPEIVFIGGAGVFSRDSVPKAKILQLECYHSVLERQPAGVALSSLSPQEIEELLGHEAESHRRKISGGHSC